MDVIDRLHRLVNESELSKKEIAHRAGMEQSDLSRLLNHRLQKPSIYAIEAVARVLGVSMEALYAEQRDTPAEMERAREALRTLAAFIERQDRALNGKRAPALKKKAPRRARPFPVAATPNVELFEGDEPLPVDVPPELWTSQARHAARVFGDSMIDAGMDPGDIVFFRPAESMAAAQGKIVVCRYGSSTYLKRLDVVGGEIRLHSENERYRPIVVREGEDFELYGIVAPKPK